MSILAAAGSRTIIEGRFTFFLSCQIFGAQEDTYRSRQCTLIFVSLFTTLRASRAKYARYKAAPHDVAD